jgi:hypothetical protein
MYIFKVVKLNGQQIFIELPNNKYDENPLAVLSLLSTGKRTDGHSDTETDRSTQADWQTDVTKLIAKFFHLFAVKAPKMWMFSVHGCDTMALNVPINCN